MDEIVSVGCDDQRRFGELDVDGKFVLRQTIGEKNCTGVGSKTKPLARRLLAYNNLKHLQGYIDRCPFIWVLRKGPERRHSPCLWWWRGSEP
jgi:hypothetical protein